MGILIRFFWLAALLFVDFIQFYMILQALRRADDAYLVGKMLRS